MKKKQSYGSVLLVCLILLLGVVSVVSCCVEPEDPVISGTTGRLELRVGVSDFEGNQGVSQTAEEAAIKSLRLCLFDTDGQELVQADRRHTIQNNKITVDLPDETIKKGLRAYVIANEEIPDDALTEAELLQYKTVRNPDDFTEKGFPMSTDRIAIAAGASQATATALLQRVPSALYIQVESPDGIDNVHNNSYKIEIEGLQRSEGALFSDMVSVVPVQGKTDYSATLTAVNSPENVVYFYQSETVKVHITPRSPELGTAKTITLENTRTAGRNKKSILKIRPVQTTAVTREMDFSVSVAVWDTEVIVTDIPFGTPSSAGGPVLLFADGVNRDSGWYDVNKAFGAEGFRPDSKLCWAATCSNMLQWWQDRYKAEGRTLPANVPDGYTPGRKNANFRQLAIFEAFSANHANKGKSATDAFTWYFLTYLRDHVPNSGLFNSSRPLCKHFLSNDVKRFSEFMIDGFKKRGVFFISGARHALTVWGCEYNSETGIVEKIYVVDSDDRDVGLATIPIRVSKNGNVAFGAAEINTLCALYAYPGRKND